MPQGRQTYNFITGEAVIRHDIETVDDVDLDEPTRGQRNRPQVDVLDTSFASRTLGRERADALKSQERFPYRNLLSETVQKADPTRAQWARSASLDQLRVAYDELSTAERTDADPVRSARDRMMHDAQTAWQRPVGEQSTFSAEPRFDAGPGDDDEPDPIATRDRMNRDAQSAWEKPLDAGGSPRGKDPSVELSGGVLHLGDFK